MQSSKRISNYPEGRSEENYTYTHPTQEEIIAYNRRESNRCGRSESDPVSLWNNSKENNNYSASIDGPGEPIDVEMVDHPTHYGGEDNPYEAIKVIEEWGLGFNLGNAIKYISRAGKKLDTLEDLEKANWYINREITKLKK